MLKSLPTVVWVLLGYGESIEGWDNGQPYLQLVYGRTLPLTGTACNTKCENFTVNVAAEVEFGCAMTGRPQTMCLGVGIIRAVDIAAGRAYVLATLDVEAMQQVNVLQV